MSDAKPKSTFGFLHDAKNVLADAERKLNAAKHLIHNARVALASTENVLLVDTRAEEKAAPPEGCYIASRESLANNLKDALELLEEVAS